MEGQLNANSNRDFGNWIRDRRGTAPKYLVAKCLEELVREKAELVRNSVKFIMLAKLIVYNCTRHTRELDINPGRDPVFKVK